MIETMKFLTITGPKADIDRVTQTFLSKYEIHLENALTALSEVSDLKPYLEVNPHKHDLQLVTELLSEFHQLLPASTSKEISLDTAVNTIQTVIKHISTIKEEKAELVKELSELEHSRENLFPFTKLDYDLSSILHFNHVKFRFGRIPRKHYDRFVSSAYDNVPSVLFPCQEDENFVWVVYFMPASKSREIDAIYASTHFERCFLPDQYEGTPGNAIHYLDDKIKNLTEKLTIYDEKIAQILKEHGANLVAAKETITIFNTHFDIRKLAACTAKTDHPFYILCGWLTSEDAIALNKELQEDANTFCFLENDHDKVRSIPPTKLKNPKLFKPFELFIDMYGLPAYGEMDPTILLGLTYAFLFGFMFGDVGQGLCLLIGGYLLYRSKKMNLAAIISCCGFFSTIFGLLFGSVFGFENIITAMWLHPKSAMTQLPFIGNLNTVFVVAIALGMGIVLFTMILSICNNLKRHNLEHAYFDTNGIAGLVFYASLTITVFLYMSGQTLPATAVLCVMFILPLLVIFCKEPLAALVEKKANIMPEEKGMFFVQGFFELFEVLLSYFSNTLSFVRVGAFAVSHAAMMEVVLMLAELENGSYNWLVIILGNLFVCGMEGLIVGIQVLRLEYYELFSRFYLGTGRAFTPYGKS